MANPTSIVASTQTTFEDTTRYMSLSGEDSSGSAAYYRTGEMIGVVTYGSHAGMVRHFDDTQPMRFSGIISGLDQQVDSATDGAYRARITRNQFFSMPVVNSAGSSTTVSRVDISKPVFSYDAGKVTLDPSALTNANLVGFVEGVLGTGNPDALTGADVVIRPCEPQETGSGFITPTALSGDVNNYNPTGFLNAKMVRINPNGAARNITGFIAGYHGQRITIQNLGAATENLVLKHASASSSAGNKIRGANLADVTVRPGGSVDIIYDAVAAVWLPIAI